MERTGRKRRIGWVRVGLMLGILGAVGIGLAWPRERLLLTVARPVVRMDPTKENAVWLSTDRLLMVNVEQNSVTGRFKNGSLTLLKQRWEVSADLLDTHTGVRTPQAELTRRLMAAPSDSFEASPDGRWFFWDTGMLGRQSGYLSHAMQLDGSHYREWKHREPIGDHFFPDARHLVQMTAPDTMIVRDLLDAAQDRKYSEPEQIRAVLTRYAVQQPFWIRVDASRKHPTDDCVEIDTYATQDRLRLLAALHHQDAVKPLQKREIRLPEGVEFEEGAASPPQKFVFYNAHKTRTNALLSWMHRILPKFDPKPTAALGLWGSRDDGSSLHEIGHIPVPLDANGNPRDWLTDLQWLPDGKEISFVYRGTLYRVAA